MSTGSTLFFGVCQCERIWLKSNAKTHGQIVITILGDDTIRSGLGILEIIPDERDVQIQMSFDFKFQRGDGVMTVLPGFLVGKDALP